LRLGLSIAPNLGFVIGNNCGNSCGDWSRRPRERVRAGCARQELSHCILLNPYLFRSVISIPVTRDACGFTLLQDISLKVSVFVNRVQVLRVRRWSFVCQAFRCQCVSAFIQEVAIVSLHPCPLNYSHPDHLVLYGWPLSDLNARPPRRVDTSSWGHPWNHLERRSSVGTGLGGPASGLGSDNVLN
jgi:hypothetical protein